MTLSVEDARRLALDDALSAHPRGDIVVIGCGNLLRGDGLSNDLNFTPHPDEFARWWSASWK